jgi:hypothetical protein
MPERWLTELGKIDRLEPSLALLERAESGPMLPDPGPRPVARMGVVLVAVLVAIGGSWGTFEAFRGSDGVERGSTDGLSAFSALWPETSLTDAQQTQARVDAGDPDVQWRTEVGAVALKYAREVLGWPDPIAGVTAANDPDTMIVSLHGPDASCQGGGCQESQPEQISVTVMLRRLVRSSEGGVWSVTTVEGGDTGTTGEPRPRIGGWPEDTDGDGMISDTGDERIPELIRAAGDHGVSGYVRYGDLEGPQPSDPAEAVAISGQQRVIPVYAADGMTVVDWYTISSGEEEPSPSPDESGAGG